MRLVLALPVSVLVLGVVLAGCGGDDAAVVATPTTSAPATEVSAPAGSAPRTSIPWCNIDSLDEEVEVFGQHDGAVYELMEHAERFTERTGTWHDISGVYGSRSPAQILMEDLSEAGTLAERIGLPPPYNELCIHPDEHGPAEDA